MRDGLHNFTQYPIRNKLQCIRHHSCNIQCSCPTYKSMGNNLATVRDVVLATSRVRSCNGGLDIEWEINKTQHNDTI